MTAPIADVRPLAEQLSAVIDETLALEEDAIRDLESIEDAVRRRDEQALEPLVASAARTEACLERCAERRDDLRRRLGRTLARPFDQVTLELLAGLLDDEAAELLGRQSDRIHDVVGRLQRQHLRTAVYVAEFARVSRALIAGLFPAEPDAGRTYRTDGSARPRAGGRLLDARS